MPGTVVVTPNPAVDITYRILVLERGATIRVEDVTRRPGGKGLNVARVLTQAGRHAHSVLPLGGRSGQWLADAVRERGLTSTVVAVSGDTRCTVTIVEDTNHPTVLAEPGPRLSPAELGEMSQRIDERLADAELLIVAGSFPPAMPLDILSQWIGSAIRHGVHVLVDTSGPALLAAAAAGAAVKSNESELRDATTAATVDAGIDELLRLGAVLVIVSRGAEGLIAATRTQRVAVAAARGITGNPTGAGDAATAGFAIALLDGESLEECARRAVAMGTAALYIPYAGEVSMDAYAELLSRSADIDGTVDADRKACS